MRNLLCMGLVILGMTSCFQKDEPAKPASEPYGYILLNGERVCEIHHVSCLRENEQEDWIFYTDASESKSFRAAEVKSWRCRCGKGDHIGYHLSFVSVDVPGRASCSMDLFRDTGNDYSSQKKTLLSAHLDDYRIGEDFSSLDFDFSLSLSTNSGTDIRIVYSGPVEYN